MMMIGSAGIGLASSRARRPRSLEELTRLYPSQHRCQGRQAPDVQGLGYGARSRRPSSPMRLCPSTVGLGFREEIG